MLLNCGVGSPCSPRDFQESSPTPQFKSIKKIKPVNPKGNQYWIFIGRTDGEAEAPILWPPDEKSQLIGKDSNEEKDWRQEEKGMATHSSIFIWKIPWTAEPGRTQSMGSQRVGHNWMTNTFHACLIFWQDINKVLASADFGYTVPSSICLWHEITLDNLICIIQIIHQWFKFYSIIYVYLYVYFLLQCWSLTEGNSCPKILCINIGITTGAKTNSNLLRFLNPQI